ncbi:MAG: peroxiredoxin family protein [Candidatus Acidulodesulfobacterium ferriphilum]|uniref:Peroxiredoxin family protein n=1 Tax=Candidatus Acidulodesulfobacterium ferriphilum TaxID=2597223 RepID=A0A519BAK6_9DELT|nr:DsrE/DsrF/DrsH-like family protein [Deltaproteobacteria bacterium]RZD14244.1 MAG: peroxiredoxin family protein [Candidatus Acidulodesulfobacterium ferriphilum]
MADQKKMAIISIHGTLDMAYPPLILASTAATLDIESAIFFTFYGLAILRKDAGDSLKVAPLGNPAMPMPVPNIIGALPGMTAMATTMMKSMIKKNGVATVPELIALCQETGVRMIACQMTMDLFGFKKEDLIDGLEFAGAASFLDYAAGADIHLAF